MNGETMCYRFLDDDRVGWHGLAHFMGNPARVHRFRIRQGRGLFAPFVPARFVTTFPCLRAAVAAGVNITYKILYNDAIAMTGGFKDFAKKKSIYVLRAKADGSQTRIPFNYNAVIKGENPSQNIRLEPRDIFYNRERSVPSSVFNWP